jgi:phosphoglycerate dehydrogenase-like enzyme
LVSREIAGAGLDVFCEEPPKNIEFLQLSNLMVTSHIGGNAKEAVEAMGKAAIQNLIEYYQLS